jgi:nucleoside-diphosphate-sugar epimerase
MNNNINMPVIFITGATGLLGGAIVSHIFEAKILCRLILLIRGDNEEICKRRVIDVAERYMNYSLLSTAISNIEIICGDLNDDQWHTDNRLDNVTHAIHLAANTSFGIEAGMSATNIDGAIAVAKAMQNKKHLKRYIHVGTAMICGATPHTIVHEDLYPAEKTRFLTRYTATKSEAEKILLTLSLELPLIIVRPSIIVGHSRLGCTPTGSIFWAFRGTHALKKITWPLENKIDVIPSDYAATVLIQLLLKPTLNYTHYHISGGTEASPTWHEINRTFSMILEEKPLKYYQTVEFENITETDVLNSLGAGPAKHFRRALRSYYQFAELDVIFTNNRLLSEGLPLPPKFTTYLNHCIKTSAHRSIYNQMQDN